MDITYKTVEQLLESGKYQIIETKVLRNLLSLTRQDIRKKICSAKEVRYILDISENTLYDLLDEKDCLIRPSTMKGKYVLSSVYEEAERLNN